MEEKNTSQQQPILENPEIESDQETPDFRVSRNLLLRSGYWGSSVFPIIAGAFTIASQNQGDPKFKVYMWLVATIVLGAGAGMRITSQRAQAKKDIQSVQYHLYQYLNKPDYLLDLGQFRHFPNMTTRLVYRFTKENPGIYDRFIKNPESIPDNPTMQDIISAYLDKHPDAAPEILKALEKIAKKVPMVQQVQDEYGVEQRLVETAEKILPVSYELRKRLERYASRTQPNEISR